MINWIKRVFSRTLRAVWKFIRAAYPIATRKIFAELKDFALYIISDLEFSDLTGDERRKKALERIKAEAKHRGITAGTRIINQLIETVLANIRENNGKSD